MYVWYDYLNRLVSIALDNEDNYTTYDFNLFIKVMKKILRALNERYTNVYMTLPVSYLAGLVVLRLYDKPITAYAIIGFFIVASVKIHITT